MHARLITAAVAAVALAAAPALAAAATKPPRPSSGAWVLSQSGFNLVQGGAFMLAKDGSAVSSLKTVPGTGANAACGTGVQVLGKRKLSLATRGGVSIWIVGKNAPKTSNGVATIAVQAKIAGKTAAGKLKLAFTTRTSGTGELTVGACQQFFSIAKKR